MNELRYYDLGYTEVFIFKNYLINQIKSGQTVEVHHAKVLKTMMEKHFANQQMIYIANRVNSYSVDPLVYSKVSKLGNLKALCIVANSEIKLSSAFYEKQFCAKPFKIFTDMSNAIIWATDQLSILK